MLWVEPSKNLTKNQLEHLAALQRYVLNEKSKLSPAESSTKEILVNVGAWILLITGDQ